jgi:Cd2+/Zn2+-exporting ATPase
MWISVILVAIASFLLSYLNVYAIVQIIQTAISLVLLFRFTFMLVRYRKFTVDALMSIAIGVSAIEGLYVESTLIALLYATAELSEEYAESYAAKKIRGLKSLVPSRVKLKRGNHILEVSADEIQPGDEIVIGHGEVVPVDGVVVSEKAVLDTSIVTGESEPLEVKKGGFVRAGYVNIGESFTVKAQRTVRESTLSILVRETERALASKSRIQVLLDRMAPWYTLFVLAAYGILAFFMGSTRALPVILAGCPSAFIVTSSFATLYAIGLLASRGIIVRGGHVLERLRTIDVIVVDKTGTITLGELRVARIETLANSVSKEDVLEIAASVAQTSRHPVSRAIMSSYRLHGGESLPAPQSAREIPGGGVEAKITGGKTVILGSKQFIEEKTKTKIPDACAGLRAVYLAVNDIPVAAICLEEHVDEALINEIRRIAESMGARIIVASGDIEERVRRVAEKLGAEYRARLDPMDKLELVKALKSKGYRVLAVGDGVNDVAALAEADVGVAVGELSIVAGVADAVITNISALSQLIRAGKGYFKALAYSFAAAATLKLVALTAGFAGTIPLWAVLGLGDDGSTLLAVATSFIALSRSIKG